MEIEIMFQEIEITIFTFKYPVANGNNVFIEF
jgi:hypothetical protein